MSNICFRLNMTAEMDGVQTHTTDNADLIDVTFDQRTCQLAIKVDAWNSLFNIVADSSEDGDSEEQHTINLSTYATDSSNLGFTEENAQDMRQLMIYKYESETWATLGELPPDSDYGALHLTAFDGAPYAPAPGQGDGTIATGGYFFDSSAGYGDTSDAASNDNLAINILRKEAEDDIDKLMLNNQSLNILIAAAAHEIFDTSGDDGSQISNNAAKYRALDDNLKASIGRERLNAILRGTQDTYTDSSETNNGEFVDGSYEGVVGDGGDTWSDNHFRVNFTPASLAMLLSQLQRAHDMGLNGRVSTDTNLEFKVGDIIVACDQTNNAVDMSSDDDAFVYGHRIRLIEELKHGIFLDADNAGNGTDEPQSYQPQSVASENNGEILDEDGVNTTVGKNDDTHNNTVLQTKRGTKLSIVLIA